jgi:hypothetical protein
VATLENAGTVDEMSSVPNVKRRLSHPPNRRSSTDAPQHSFARLLKSAVVINWTDLISAGQSGVVHVDCRFGDQEEVDHLTIWVATERGEWRLAGEYFKSHTKRSLSGMKFEGDYRSEKLACTLDTIFEHQHSFAPLPNAGRDGLIEVEQPTSRERRVAENAIASMLRSLQQG